MLRLAHPQENGPDLIIYDARHFVAFSEADLAAAQAYSDKLRAAHAGQKSQTIWSDHDHNLIGILGEWAVRSLLRLPLDATFLGGLGDDGADLVYKGKRLDVKCAMKPKHLMAPADRKLRADLYILSGIRTPVVGVFGFATREEFENAKVAVFMKDGPKSRYIPRAELHPFEELME